MSGRAADVTIIVNAHSEGLLIHRTVRSVLAAAECAEAAGIRCELLAVLDSADSATRRYFDSGLGQCFTRHDVTLRDLGGARNHGVAEASGRYVAFVDGDDLVSRNWIRDAFRFYENRAEGTPGCVLHPELNVVFGTECTIFHHVDQESPEFDIGTLVVANYWTALAFARRSDLLALPYRPTLKGSGFGFEDWDWNCLAISAGLVHKVVPGTYHFIRRRHDSLMDRSRRSSALVRPSPVFAELARLPAPEHHAQAGGPETGPSDEGRPRLLQTLLASTRLLEEWRSMAQIEPELFPGLEFLSYYAPYTPSGGRAGALLGEILRQWGDASTHVILCPMLPVGETGVIRHAQLLVQSGKDVTVVTTLAQPSPSANRLPPGVRLVEFGQLCEGESPWLQRVLLARALLQFPPKTLLIQASNLGYEVLEEFGTAIVEQSRVFATIFCNAYFHLDAAPFGHAIKYLSRVLPFLQGVLSDNRHFLDWLQRTYAWPAEQCHVVYFPHAADGQCRPARPFGEARRPRALWASRFDRQKFPAMLAEVARALPGWDFRVEGDLAGDFLAGASLREDLAAMPNVMLGSRYERFDDISEGADAFLYTSLWDGLPNVLIEACMSGLPVVASDVGGVSELIDDETGYLVRDAHAAEAYVTALQAVISDPAAAAVRVHAAQRRIRERHSWEAFATAVRSIPGFLVRS